MLRRSFISRSAMLLLAGAGALAVAPAQAETPALRWQADMRGDVRIFGSPLAHDCHSPAPPAPATVACTSSLNNDDTAPDLYWRDNTADKTILPTEARTSATLDLPAGSKVVYARLYWAAHKEGNTPDKTATLDWLNSPDTKEVTADVTNVVPHPYNATNPTWYMYQSSGDVTDYVAKWGAGDFRVSGVEAITLADKTIDVTFAAWTLVVFYENDAEDLRNLALFDGLFYVDPPTTPAASVLLKGFLVPPSGFSAKMAAFVYEGDFEYKSDATHPKGDAFLMNGITMSNALNPADNFFNSSRTYLGTAFSGQYDIPKLTGQPDTMAGYDLDMIDVTNAVKGGDTQATVKASSDYDKYHIGGFVTSLTNLAPDFNNLVKKVTDLNGGAVVKGDIVEYLISGANHGNDAATEAVLTDKLQAGLEFVPGSIEIVEGGATGIKTDKAGDDEGEYDAASKTITWRLGVGATATVGGTLAKGAAVKVRFKAKVTADKGTVGNKGILEAGGQSGGVKKTWETDGDPNALGKQDTIITLKECSSNADCPAEKPHCDLNTNVCVGCVSDADCSDPAKPACQPNGTCGECSATNDKLCKIPKPECNTTLGVCVLCLPGTNPAEACQGSVDGPACVSSSGTVFCGCETDADCGSKTSGKVCDAKVQKCTDGCRGKDGNGCPTDKECTSPDSSIGQCVLPKPDAGAAGAAGGPPAPQVANSGDEGGCGCSTPGQRDLGLAGITLAMLALGSAAARRRRRRD